MRRRWRNRRGAPALAVVTWLYILWSLVPVLVAVLSLNDGRAGRPSSRCPGAGTGVMPPSLFHDDSLHTAMITTLELAGMTAVRHTARRGHGHRPALLAGAHVAANGLMQLIVTPEIVFGVSLFLVFPAVHRRARRAHPPGAGHITFTVPFVVVRGRLSAIGGQYGARPGPPVAGDPSGTAALLALAIFAAGMVVFATSVDDFDLVVPVHRRVHRDRADQDLPASRAGPPTPNAGHSDDAATSRPWAVRR